MSFAPTNALATFHNSINKILVIKFNIFVFVYLNDIFIYTESDGKECVGIISWVLDQLRK